MTQKIHALSKELRAEIVRHFDLLYARAQVTDGPSAYGETSMGKYPGWDADEEANYAYGWIYGVAAATSIDVATLSAFANASTELPSGSSRSGIAPIVGSSSS